MPDEAKPEDTENLPQIQSPAEGDRKWSINERMQWMRERGVRVIDASMVGKNIAIIGIPSGPPDAAPQPADLPNPNSPAGYPEAGQAETKEPKSTETLLQRLRKKGFKIANDDSPTSGGFTIIGAGKPPQDKAS